MRENLTSLAVRGFKWSYLAALVNVVLVTGMTALLARLLEPSAFGLVAMANILLRVAGYITAGFEPTIIQKKALSQADIRTSFTLSSLLSLIGFAFIYVLAPLAVHLMPSPDVVPILRALALSLIITGLSATAIGLLKRQLEFRTLAKIEIIAYVTGYCGVGLSMAATGYGIWSLVAASLTQSIVSATLAYWHVRHSCRPTIDRESRSHLISFGGKATLLGFMEFLGFNVDNLIIGRTMGPAALGIYTRAMALVDMPVQAVTTPLLKVSFPAMSQLQSDYAKLREAFVSILTVLTIVSVPVAVGVMPAASNIVLTLLGPKWTASIPVLQVLAGLIPLAMVTGFLGSVCTATGHLKGRLWIQTAFIFLLTAVLIFYSERGLVVLATVVVAAHGVRLAAYLLLVKVILEFSFLDLGKSLFPGFVAAAAVYTTISTAHHALTDVAAPFALVVEMTIGAVTLFAVLAALPIPTLKPILQRVQAQAPGLGMGRHVVSWLLRRYA